MHDEQRDDPRKRLFVAATLHVGATKCAVTIRDVSATGARMELQVPPPVGTDIELRRGSLIAKGLVVWTNHAACGIRFDAPIILERWIPNAGQQRVDDLVADLRSGRARTMAPARSEAIPEDELNQRISEELAFLARSLEALGDELSDDPYIATRHGIRLQSLDVTKQVLEHLSRILTSPSPGEAIAALGMSELRRRLTRKTL